MGRGDEFGTLEAGKLADVLVVDGDVLADIALLEDRSRFIAVMQGGVVKAGEGEGRAMTEEEWLACTDPVPLTSRSSNAEVTSDGSGGSSMSPAVGDAWEDSRCRS